MALLFGLVIPLAIASVVLFVVASQNNNIVVKTLAKVFAVLAGVGLVVALFSMW